MFCLRRNHNSICFILPGWITKVHGGAELQCYLISDEFVKRGWDVSVITSKPKSIISPSKYHNPKIKYYYYPVVKFKTIQFLIAWFFILKCPSVYYYTRTDDRIFRAACGMVCKLTGRKMIYAIAGDDELEHNSFNINRDSACIIRIIRFFDFGIVNLLTNRSEHMANLIIAQTYVQHDKLMELKSLNSIVIRNSYQTNIQKYEHGSKENIIVWIGNLRKVKQPEIFVEIATKFKWSNYTFLLIGETNEYRFADLPTNLQILGPLPKSDVLRYLKISKLLINTSISEGFSNTFLEAWANNTFVISLNSNPDNLLDNILGFFANGKIEILEKKIEEFILDDKLDFQVVGARFATIVKEFILRTNVDKLISAIRRLSNTTTIL